MLNRSKLFVGENFLTMRSCIIFKGKEKVVAKWMIALFTIITIHDCFIEHAVIKFWMNRWIAGSCFIFFAFITNVKILEICQIIKYRIVARDTDVGIQSEIFKISQARNSGKMFIINCIATKVESF